jgi:TM2 domain-containing membrane protein YozV
MVNDCINHQPSTINHSAVMESQPQKHGVPALLSFFCPGLGQLVKGDIGKGIGMFMGAFVGLCFGGIPTLIIWIWSMVDAYNYNPPQALFRTQAPPQPEVQFIEVSQMQAPIETAPNFVRHKVLGVLFFLAGVFFSTGAIPVSLPMWLGAFPAAFGVFMFWNALRQERRYKEEKERERRLEMEQKVLTLAQQREGKLTAAEVATALEIALDEAKQFLDEMASGGHASVKLTPSAVWVYQFFDVASEKEKALADEPWNKGWEAQQKTLKPAEEPPPPQQQTN